MRLRVYSLLLVSLGLSACASHEDEPFNKSYAVGAIPELGKFQQLTSYESQMDRSSQAMKTEMDSALGTLPSTAVASIYSEQLATQEFKSNRARLFLERYIDDTLEASPNNPEAKLFTENGIPTICRCEVRNDTLNVTAGFGFFGSAGIQTKIHGTDFSANFFEEADDEEPFALKPDGPFTGHLTVPSAGQSLTLDAKPTLKSGQQLTGYVTLTTQDFYRKSAGDKADKNHIRARMYFTCHVAPQIPAKQ